MLIIPHNRLTKLLMGVLDAQWEPATHFQKRLLDLWHGYNLVQACLTKRDDMDIWRDVNFVAHEIFINRFIAIFSKLI